MRRLTGAADAREDRDLVRIELQLSERHLDASEDAEVPAVCEERRPRCVRVHVLDFEVVDVAAYSMTSLASTLKSA